MGWVPLPGYQIRNRLSFIRGKLENLSISELCCDYKRKKMIPLIGMPVFA